VRGNWSIRDRLVALGGRVSADDPMVTRFAEGLSLTVAAHLGRGWRVSVTDDAEPDAPIWEMVAKDAVALESAVYLAVERARARQYVKAGTGNRIPVWHGPRHGECERCGFPVGGVDERLSVVDAKSGDGYLWVCPDCLRVADQWRDLILTKGS
jgi:hypothetical protein